MTTPRRQLQRRAVLALLVAIPILGTAALGWDFAIIPLPLPVPDPIAAIWNSVNGFLSFVALILIYCNLHRYRHHWTWQETAFAQGVFCVLLGAGLGYFVRSFMDPIVTLGTPYLSLGLTLIIYGSLSAPIRFDAVVSSPDEEDLE